MGIHVNCYTCGKRIFVANYSKDKAYFCSEKCYLAALTPEERDEYEATQSAQRKQLEAQSNRKRKRIRITLIVFVAFLLLGVAGTYFAHFLGASRTLAEKNYEKYLSFFEGDSLLDDSSPDITLDTFKKSIENSNDCMLYIFDEENCSRIQKYTGDGKTTYVFDIRSDLLEGLSQGNYWYDGEKIVTSTEEEKAYYPSSQEYAALLEKLTQLLPQNFIPCEVPEKSVMYLPTDKDIMAYKLTGENTSIVIHYELTDDGHDDYYEKTDKKLIRVSFVRTTMIKSMPDSEEYKEIR